MNEDAKAAARVPAIYSTNRNNTGIIIEDKTMEAILKVTQDLPKIEMNGIKKNADIVSSNSNIGTKGKYISPLMADTAT